MSQRALRTSLFSASVGAALLFASIASFLTWRTWTHLHELGKQADDVRWGMIDFRDVICFPTRAILDGVNPYDAEVTADPSRYRGRYPVGNVFPLYSPLLLLLDSPLQLLPYSYAMLLYGSINVALVVIATWLILRFHCSTVSLATVFLLGSAILLSRPGQSNFYYGQLALPMVICTLVATYMSHSNPVLAMLAVTLATIKPTFGGPLIILLLCQRRWFVAGWGALLGGGLAIVGFALVFAFFSRDAPVAEIIFSNVGQTEADPGFDPRQTGLRLDAVALLQRFLPASSDAGTSPLLTIAILALAGFALYRLSSRQEHASNQWLSTIIIPLSVLISIFHAVYDGLLLVAPIVALLYRRPGDVPGGKWTPRVLLVLLLIPFVNVLAARQFWAAIGSQLGFSLHVSDAPLCWTLITSLNGACLLAAWAILITLALRRFPRATLLGNG